MSAILIVASPDAFTEMLGIFAKQLEQFESELFILQRVQKFTVCSHIL